MHSPSTTNCEPPPPHTSLFTEISPFYLLLIQSILGNFVAPIMSLAPRIAHTETTFHAFFLFCHSRLFLIVLFRPLSEDDAILILPTKAPRCKTEHAIKKFLTTLNCKIVYMLLAYISYLNSECWWCSLEDKSTPGNTNR